jgi:hypothetical protein
MGGCVRSQRAGLGERLVAGNTSKPAGLVLSKAV